MLQNIFISMIVKNNTLSKIYRVSNQDLSLDLSQVTLNVQRWRTMRKQGRNIELQFFFFLNQHNKKYRNILITFFFHLNIL